MSKTPNLRFKEFSGDYKKTQFSDCVSIKNGQVNPCIEPYCDMPHIGPGNMEKFTGRLLDVRTAKEDGQMSGKYLFDKDDILYGKINPQFGKVVFPKYEGLCSADTYPLKALKGMVSGYLFYSLQTSRFLKYSISVSMRTGMPKINREELSLYNFNLPKTEEQEKIASFFSLIDDKICLQSEKVEVLKDYKTGMMQKIFSRELRFKDDDGRDYPEWEEKKLDDLIKIKSNRNKNSVVELVLSVSNTKGFITQSEQFEDRIVASSDISNYKIVEKDDFAFNPARINVGSIARLKLYDKGIISPMYICFKCLNSLESDYLEYFLMTHSFDVQMKKKLEGSVRQTLSSEALGEIVIDLPCLNEQKKIGEYLSTINDKLVKEQEKLDYLNEYKKGLLQQMFV